MTNSEIQAVVRGVLRTISPEIDPATLDPAVNLRDQIDLDSMDFLNFVLALNQATGVDIPERDYPKLSSLDACAAYLAAHGARDATTAAPPG
jgi:acyl carrier protein